MKALTTLFVIGMFVTTVAIADDVDDVRAALNGHFAARNAGDADSIVQYLVPDFNRFSAGGGLLWKSDALEEQKNYHKAPIDAGVKFNAQYRHVEVKVYGNAAVATGYTVGTTTQPDGTTRQATNRRTVVLIKQAGQWKQVHGHSSPLRGPQ